MAEKIKTGDMVEITIRGKVGDGGFTNGTHAVRTDFGITHYVFLGGRLAPMEDGETGCGLTVKKLESFEFNHAYQDADGDVFIRARNNEWVSVTGLRQCNEYPARPLVKLVPEA